MIRTRIFLALLLSVFLVNANLKAQGEGSSTPEKKPVPVQAEKKPQPKSYRLTIAIKEVDGSKSVYEKSYNIDAIADSGRGSNGFVRDGERVPYKSDKGSEVFDIGTNIDVSVIDHNEESITVNIGVTRSLLADKPDGVNIPLIKQLKVSANTVLQPGKTVVIYSDLDATTGHKVLIEATATVI
jgi:hypothetical protein